MDQQNQEEEKTQESKKQKYLDRNNNSVYVFSSLEIAKKFKKKVRERLAKVRTLYFVKGLTILEIAEHLKVGQSTVEKDIKTIRQIGKLSTQEDLALKADIENFLWEAQAAYEERIRRLWAYEANTTDVNEKTKIIKEIRNNEEQHILLLQDLGLLPKKTVENTTKNIVYISRLGEVHNIKPRVPAQVYNGEIIQEVNSDGKELN